MEFLHIDAPVTRPAPATTPPPPTATSTPAVPLKNLIFKITRQPFTDYFMIHLVDTATGLPSGQTEEFDVDETIEWFRARGADIAILEKALDHIWNFYKGTFEITNYREPVAKNTAIRPRLD